MHSKAPSTNCGAATTGRTQAGVYQIWNWRSDDLDVWNTPGKNPRLNNPERLAIRTQIGKLLCGGRKLRKRRRGRRLLTHVGHGRRRLDIARGDWP